MEQDAYIFKYLNSKSSVLSFYVPRIFDPKTSNLERHHYTQRIIRLVNDVQNVLNTLNIQRMPINSFFNQLYLLEKYYIKEVSNLLEDYHYRDELNKSYLRILRSVSLQRKLKPEDLLCIEFLINNNLVEDETLVYEYYLQMVLVGNIELSYDAFENLFRNYALLKMREYLPNPKCYVVNENALLGMQSYSIKESVFLNREDIYSFYYSGKYKAIKNLFHELGHIKQYKEIMIDKKYDEYAMKEIKEEILSAYVPNYYNDNYSLISYEAEAELFAITELLKLFKKFGLQFKDGINPYLQTIQNIINHSKNDMRIYGDGKENLYELFDTVIIHHPELLERYPQLKNEYKIDYEDCVVPKKF
ncbi:MAG: hypothetical protein E7164_01000 [Firmicutes bacterium]|nr:hypothetical protein [Bacillota bacterium]